jgi:large subunit ribosomal protein L34
MILLFKNSDGIIEGMSFTYNPKKKKRKTTHGFLVRQATPTGRRVLSRRRAKGRKKLAV